MDMITQQMQNAVLSSHQKGVIFVLLCLAVALVLIPGLLFLGRRLYQILFWRSAKRSRVSKLLVSSALMILSAFCLRYAVGYFSYCAQGEEAALTWWEEIANSMVHALQTFSMDEDYTSYIAVGKLTVEKVFGARELWVILYGAFASAVNVLAPILGGAALFEILANVFPKFKLFFARCKCWRRKLFFSKLNESSLALAESISVRKRYFSFRPVVVFTDAYMDDGEEKSSELILGAKSLGAICIRDDLCHAGKRCLGRRSFFLCDEEEAGNLQTLAALASPKKNRYLKRSQIYFFVSSDAYVQVEKSVSDKLAGDWRMQKEHKTFPVFVPVARYRNLISNLLTELPLYEPLIGTDPKEKDSLTVTVLGTGKIGTEMVLTTYWIGQLLDRKLRINVVSKESERDFRSRIDFVNPEIGDSAKPNHPLLKLYGDQEAYSEPYCQLNYFEFDVNSSSFLTELKNPKGQIAQTDYFLVALGSDEENVYLANTVKRYVGERHLSPPAARREGRPPERTVIAYVVYNPELSGMLNRTKCYSHTQGATDVYMQAVGDLKTVFSARNVFMSDHEEAEKRSQAKYDAAHVRKDSGKKKGESWESRQRKRLANDYSHWANLARGMHNRYKMFSCGLFEHSVMDVCSGEPGEARRSVGMVSRQEYDASLVRAHQDWEELCSCFDPGRIALLHRLSWLEHRRWCAFTRVKGFRHTKNYESYGIKGKMGSYKHMELKLHPCLVECDSKGIRMKADEKKILAKGPILLSSPEGSMDFLDELSYHLKELEYNNYDFKQYDYIIDTEQVQLPQGFLTAAAEMAAVTHDARVEKLLSQGWKRSKKDGPEDKKAGTAPYLAPFGSLKRSVQEKLAEPAVAQMKLAYMLGYRVNEAEGSLSVTKKRRRGSHV